MAVVVWLLLILPVGGFLLVSALIMAYVYWPGSFSEIDLARFDNKNAHTVVLVHGVKDDLTTWVAPLKRIYEEKASEHEGAGVIGFDWSAYAQSSITCAINGRRIGRQIGQRMAASNTANSIHLIAHSCGAFVIYGACEAIKEAHNPVVVQTTYLAPVSVHGLSWNYGINHFGSCADYSEAYVDGEDGVPGSNRLIPNTHTYDVTDVRKQSGSEVSPHLWPIAYYGQLVADGRAPRYWHDQGLKVRKPAGELERVDDEDH